MVGKGAFFLFLVSSLASSSASFPWESCAYLPLPECSCWDPSLPTVNCAHLNLTSIPQQSQDDYRSWPVIHTLDLSHNNIGNVSRSSFFNLKVERLLICNNSAILSFDRHAFSGSMRETLKFLSLRNSGLTHEPWLVYDSLANLEILDLSGNRISSIEHLHLLPNLKTFRMEDNPLRQFDSAHTGLDLHSLHVSLSSRQSMQDLSSADTFSSLQDLRISHTRLRQDRFSFENFRALRTLSLVDCSLVDFEFSSNGFSLGHLSRYLVYLDLSHNKLTSVPTRLLRSVQNLEDLNLSHNRITRILSADIPLQAVKRIDLSHNRIQLISSLAFPRIGALIELRLDHNRLGYMLASAVPDSVQMLTLYSNRFNCNCSKLRWIVEEARREVQDGQPGMFTTSDIIHKPICKEDNEAMRTLRELISNDFCVMK